MKPFNLEEYLKNPNREVVTRDGHKVRIICTDRKNHENFPIVALVETDEDYEVVRCFKIDGTWSVNGLASDHDLFFAPTKHEGWINIYKENKNFKGQCIYPSEKEAYNEGKNIYNYIATIKIEWEE